MKAAVVALLALLALAAPAVGGDAPAAGETDTVLARIEAAVAGVRTLASDLIQEKHLAMFDEVLTSRGRFYFQAPDRLRWELLEPVRSGFSLRGGRGRRWHERTGESEAFDIRSEPAMQLIADQLLAWARADFGWLRRQYRIEVEAAAPATLRLEPRAAGAGAYLDHLRIVFSADDRYVETVEVFEADGDFTRIRFTHTVVNGPVDEGLF